MLRPYRSSVPRVHPTAFVDDSAQVIGSVEIGEESGVWMNAVRRGDVNTVRVGRQTNLQDWCIVPVLPAPPPAWLGDRGPVGHGAILHGCPVRDRCLIGVGAILLNGAEIGE